MKKPLIIAHRGASGYRPEHTSASYRLAVEQGADFIEPDLVSTRDGHLIARHDNVLNLTTDVASHAEFADKKTIKTVDGKKIEGWFSEDFTLAEIKTLRAVERIPELRPANVEYDGQFEILTLEEIIALTQELEREHDRTIGLYIETKHPSYFASLGLALEVPLLEKLHAVGYDGNKAPIFLQSFEVENLKWLRAHTELALIQLLWSSGQPADVMLRGDSLDYDGMVTRDGLEAIARYANGVGPEKSHFLLAADDHGRLDAKNASDLVSNAHTVGLDVHAHTFRAENAFLPDALRSSDREDLPGLLEQEILTFMELGVDGVFTDNPDIGVQAKQRFLVRSVS
ncbi:MAG: glycerophosphodiester phosphodiesterase [Proteobacteria bacterium]|jgi:glycerophosphoryl diester phosphodiesterase|nr:glycerophosphodiester phosphodiesterase [Pseudomonadota bacterium]